MRSHSLKVLYFQADFINQCYAYKTVRSYACRSGMAMVDYTAIYKLARTFDVMIEDLVEILEE
ncbi:MAG: hypothetical protein Fur006_63580 [Coleofasciculaceae cyanobacterium]